MVVEPLGSVMSVQAQSTMTGRTAAAEERPEVLNKSPEVQEVAKVDKTLNVIENTRNKDQFLNNDARERDTQEQNNEQIRKAVEKLNKSMPHSEAIFGIHEDTNRVMIKIVDRDTKEVIKELPPEKTLDMIARVWEMAGIMVDEKR